MPRNPKNMTPQEEMEKLSSIIPVYEAVRQRAEIKRQYAKEKYFREVIEESWRRFEILKLSEKILEALQ